MTTLTPEEHPFATFIRMLGKGQRGARDLSEAEACQAMGLLLEGQVQPVQLGAFLMLLRHKEETAEELAGFTRAVRQRLQAPALPVDLDWPSYAGKKRHLPWYLLAARCLAQNGIRIFMHGAGPHTAGRLYTEQLLSILDIPDCQDWKAVRQALDQQQLAFMSLGRWMPALQEMIGLRPLLGLRSPIHSLARGLNPLAARCSLQSIFHPGYQPVHQQASALLGDQAIVIKGEGGEVEVNPDSPALLLGTSAGQLWEEEWPASGEQRQVKPERLDPAHLLAVWQGRQADPYGEQAIIGTMALGLRGLGQPMAEAMAQARQWWRERNG